MSFAGHTRSFNLFARASTVADHRHHDWKSNHYKRSDPTSSVLESPASPPGTSEGEFSDASDDSNTQNSLSRRSGDLCPSENGRRVPYSTAHTRYVKRDGFDDISMYGKDEEGNSPSSTLIVFDARPGLTTSEIRERFGRTWVKQVRFGGGGKCIFVEYNEVSSACRMREVLNNQAVFERDKLISVRYARPQGAQTQNFPPSKHHRSSIGEVPTALCEEKSPLYRRESHRWAGREPPLGPRSQQRTISPPRIQRNNSRIDRYVPEDREERPGSRDRVLPEASRGRLRHSDSYRARYPSSHEDDISDDLSMMPPRKHQADSKILTDRIEPADDYVELRRVDLLSNPTSIPINPARAALISTAAYLEQNLGEEIADNNDGDRALDTNNGYEPGRTCWVDAAEKELEGNGEINAQSRDRDDAPGASIRGLARKSLSPSKVPSEQVMSSRKTPEAPVSVEVTKSKTPDAVKLSDSAGFNYLAALYPAEDNAHAATLKKIRALSPYDRKRASNTPLSDLTSSSKSSSMRKKCSFCKNPESNFQSLIPCTSCPRKYHNICGDPRPDKAPKGTFVCGRCLQKGRTKGGEGVVVPSATTVTGNVTTSTPTLDNDMLISSRSLPPQPRFDNLFPEKSIIDDRPDMPPIEPANTNSTARLAESVDETMAKQVHDSEAADRQGRLTEHSERPEHLPETSISMNKPCESRGSVAVHSLDHNDEAGAQTSPAQCLGKGKQIHGLSSLERIANTTESIKEPARRIEPPSAPKAMRDAISNGYGGSHEVEDWNLTTAFEDKENIPHDARTSHSLNRYSKFHSAPDPHILVSAQAVAKKYKNVTCTWWAEKSCSRAEHDCMFAHRYTDIEAPMGFNRAKQWTCPLWLERHEVCRRGAEDCLYAHHDTGYYIGRDNRALKKHLTCHWYHRRGRCNKPDDECLFAHHWTGLVAEEPRDKLGRNSLGSYEHRPFRPAAVETSATQLPSILTAQQNSSQIPSFVQSPTQLTSSKRPPTEKDHGLATAYELDAKDANHNSSLMPSIDDFSSKTPLVDPRARTNTNTSTPPVALPPTNRAKIGWGDPRGTLLSETASSYPEASESEGPQRRTSIGGSVKECKSCGKKVIGRDMCVACQKPDQASEGSPSAFAAGKPKKGGEAQSELPGPAEIDVEMAEMTESTVLNDFSTTAQATQKVLKRAASGSSMFVSSKRSRPNPPPALRKEPRPRIVPPSIEEAIATEKAEKSQHNLPEVDKRGDPIIHRRSLEVLEITSPGLDLDQLSLARPAPPAQSTAMVDTATAVDTSKKPQALNRSVPSHRNGNHQEAETSTPQIPQASSPMLQMSDPNEVFEDIEHSVTESLQPTSRLKDTSTRQTNSVSIDEELEIPHAPASRQFRENKIKISEQDKLWSSSTNSSQGTTAARQVTIAAPKQLSNGRYECPFTCGKTFTAAKHAERHAADLHINVIRYQCEICGKGYYRKDKYQEHTRSHKGKDVASRKSTRSAVDKEPTVGSKSYGARPSRGSSIVEDETGPEFSAQSPEPITLPDPGPGLQDENLGNKEITNTAVSSASRRGNRSEEATRGKGLTSSAVAPEVVDNDEDETDSDDSDEQPARACEGCQLHGTGEKCLHGARGQLDGKKCDAHISERVARNIQYFGAESSYTWNIIEDAALDSRYTWQNLQWIRPMDQSTEEEGVIVKPATLTFRDPGPALLLDSERPLEIHNYGNSPILFKAQILLGSCEQDWEIEPNWGYIPTGHMLGVCVRRKINRLPLRCRRSSPLSVQYPEQISISYLHTSQRSAGGSCVRLWELLEEQSMGLGQTKIRIPVTYSEETSLPDSDNESNTIGRSSDLGIANDYGVDDRDELTLSEVETPYPARKVRGKPVVVIPPRKPANKSQGQGVPKLTLKFATSHQGGASLLGIAADKTSNGLPQNAGKTQDMVNGGKAADTLRPAAPIKKINLKIRQPQGQSPVKSTPEARGQHRRTASEATSRSDKSPHKSSKAVSSLHAADEETEHKASRQVNDEQSSNGRQRVEREELPLPAARLQYQRTASRSTSTSMQSPRKRTRADTDLDVTTEESETLRQENPPNSHLQHVMKASDSTNKDTGSPLKARQHIGLGSANRQIGVTRSATGKNRNNPKRKEPSAELLTSIARLKARGVKFEDPDTDEEEDEPEKFPSSIAAPATPRFSYPPSNPLQSFLFTRDKHSAYYKPENDLLTPAPDLPLPKITKGKGMKNPSVVRGRQMLRNLWLHGNAHKECDRKLPLQEVYAMVERKIPDPNDRWAHDTLLAEEEKITFREFCGLKRDAEFEPCLVGQGDSVRLAFREKECGRPGSSGGVVPGRRKRVADGEKWPVS